MALHKKQEELCLQLGNKDRLQRSSEQRKRSHPRTSGIFGSVATLQEWSDKLGLAPSVAGLFKWRQFEPEVISWPSVGICDSRSSIATSKSCSPSGACAPITSPSGDGSSVTPRLSDTITARSWKNVDTDLPRRSLLPLWYDGSAPDLSAFLET
jgi:hypothetical protein